MPATHFAFLVISVMLASALTVALWFFAGAPAAALTTAALLLVALVLRLRL